jgi:hypothetical protein
MAMNLLERLATSRLPVTLTSPAEVDQVRILRAAGLVIALTPPPGDPLSSCAGDRYAQVLALTQKGLEELHRSTYPAHASPPKRSGLMARLSDALDRVNDR